MSSTGVGGEGGGVDVWRGVVILSESLSFGDAAPVVFVVVEVVMGVEGRRGRRGEVELVLVVSGESRGRALRDDKEVDDEEGCFRVLGRCVLELEPEVDEADEGCGLVLPVPVPFPLVALVDFICTFGRQVCECEVWRVDENEGLLVVAVGLLVLLVLANANILPLAAITKLEVWWQRQRAKVDPTPTTKNGGQR